MYDALRVSVIERFGYGTKNSQGFVHWCGATRNLLESAACDQFRYDECEPFVFTKIVYLQDIRVAQPRDCLGFLRKTTRKSRVVGVEGLSVPAGRQAFR